MQTAPLDPGSEQEHGWRARWEQARTSTMMSVGVCSTGVPVEASISCSHVHAPRHVSCVRRGPTVREQAPGRLCIRQAAALAGGACSWCSTSLAVAPLTGGERRPALCPEAAWSKVRTSAPMREPAGSAQAAGGRTVRIMVVWLTCTLT